MNYRLLILCFSIINSVAFPQSRDEKIDSVYQAVDRSNTDSLIKSYQVIFRFLKNTSYDNAVNKYKELRTKTLDKENNYFEEFLIGNYLAWSYAKKDKKKGVSEYYSIVKTIPQMKIKEQAYAYYYAGKFYLFAGMPNLGAKYLLKATDAFKLTGNQVNLFRIYFTLGDTYYKNRLYREAIKKMLQALAYYPSISENNKNPESSFDKMYMSACNTIALAYENLGLTDSAQLYYKCAKQIAIKTNNLVWQYIIDANLGHIYIKNKKYDSAEIAFKKDEKISKKYHMANSIINDMMQLAQIYLLTGKLDSSKSQLELCKQYALRHNKPLPYQYYKVSSQLNEKKGNFKKALEQLKRYYFLRDSVKNIILSKKMGEINIEYSLEKEQSRLREMEILNKIKSDKIMIQTVVITGLILLSIALIILFVLYYRDRKKISDLNTKLRTANEKLQAGNKELSLALQSLKTTQAQLIQNEKMASLGILTSGIAHEINNPLNYIMGAYVGLTDFFNENHFKNQKEIEIFLKSIAEGIKRISSIIKGLNEFSRNNSNYEENCDIHFILDNCIFLLGSTIKHRIEVQKEYFSGSLTIKGNAGKLHQAFFNILLNSTQAIKNKGTITIKTAKDNNKISITIKDDGYGISKEDIKRITVPFFTTKAPGEGVGLGLSISHSIIKKHNGTIIFDSEKGKGTTVTITFTLKNDET